MSLATSCPLATGSISEEKTAQGFTASCASYLFIHLLVVYAEASRAIPSRTERRVEANDKNLLKDAKSDVILKDK